MWVCVCVQHIDQNDQKDVGGSKNIPMERCELHDALNLFGCCCQANEVSE